MKKSAAVAYIRRLCCSGINSQHLMPDLLPAVRKLVRADHGIFCWIDRSLEISNVYPEYPVPRELGTLYFNEFYNKRECEVWPGFSEALRSEYGVVNVASRQTKQFFESSLYHEIWKPLSMHHCIRITLCDKQIPIASLRLYRSRAMSSFERADEVVLTQLVPYLTHLVSAQHTVTVTTYDECAETGLIVLNTRGEMQYASPKGRHLLFLSGHPVISRKSLERAVTDDGTRAQLKALCKRLVAIFADQLAPIPVLYRRNAWGQFKLEAHWLEQSAAMQSGLIGVHIRRDEPMRLRLLRCMRDIALSPKQQDVALLLADGYTHPQIADALHVTANTVITHVRAIYDTLGVHSRVEMMDTLLRRDDERIERSI